MKERKSNIELLRIVAMLLIILGHSASHGVHHFGELGEFELYLSGTGFAKLFSSMLLPGGAVGVGLFFMITGYFQILKDSYSMKKTILTCLFYGLFISCIYVVIYIVKDEAAGIGLLDFLYGFFIKTLINPVSGGAWWYISAYFMIMVLSPLINNFLRKLSRRGIITVIIFVLLCWYSIPYLTGGSYIQLQRGLLFYILGAYIRLYGKADGKATIKQLVIFAVAWITGAIAYYYYVDLRALGVYSAARNRILSDLLDLYVFSVVTPVCVVAFFTFFKNLNMKEHKVVNTIAGTTLSIYLLHDSVVLRPIIWSDVFKMHRIYLKSLYPVYVVFIVVIIFVVCMIIDLVRKKLIEPHMIKIADKVCDNVSQKIFKT